MPSTYNKHANSQSRTYNRANSVVFLKTKEAFGGLSNMAGGFPLKVNGIRILTSEALYQVCRFPHLPEVQKLIISQKSPMTAKMKGKPHRAKSRPDWDRVQIKIMRWCLRVKLAQNWNTFRKLLLETGERPIVEESRRDAFWGAKPVDEQTLVGMNVLGRLLMELREEVKNCHPASLHRVEPLDIPDFRIYDQQIQPVEAEGITEDPKVAPRLDRPAPPSELPAKPVQTSLFDQLLPISETELRWREVEHTGASIDDLKPYPAMKDSGVQWLGQVPTHWDILPNRAIFEEVKERGHPYEEMLSVTIKRGVILQKTMLSDSSKKDSSNQNKSAYKLVCPKDIAYNKMRAWQGAIGASNFRGIVSPAYVVMRQRKKYKPHYFHYLFRTPHFAKEAERWSYGITSDMWSLRPEHFKMIYIPIPPKAEQAAIVKFLDHATRRLNRAIRAKQKVIALLNEQKQVIIHRAVTRGLDTNVPLKPTGVPWLGDIPKQWTLMRFKFVGRINSGQVDPRLSQYRDLTLIAPNHIEAGTGKILFQRTANEQGADSGKYLASKGQILYSKIRPNLRKVTIAPCDCLCSADMYPISPKKGLILTDFLVLLMLSKPFTNYTVDCSMRVAMPKVNREALGNCWLWFPRSLDEQTIILNAVRRENRPLDSAISFIDRQITLLQEFRTRMIADVVTGKLDVCEAATRLPAETYEVEPDMEAIVTIEDEFQEPENTGEAYG